MKVLQAVKACWRILVVVLCPIILCPFVFPYSEKSSESKCAAVILLMAVYWITEAIPLPATALLPIALCPLLGVASVNDMCAKFFADVTFLLVGGIFVAIAVEESKLHKRISLRILMLIGVKPRRLMLGIMLTTAFLSMWISNTATTAMMMPITRALLAKLFSSSHKARREEQKQQELKLLDQDIITEDLEMTGISDKRPSQLQNVESFTRLRDLTTVFRIGDEITSAPLDQPEPHLLHHPLSPPHGEQRRHETEPVPLHTQMEKLEEEKEHVQGEGEEEEAIMDGEADDADEILNNLNPQELATLKSFSLSICYSASVGGVATLTGTLPNIVLSRMAAEMTEDSPITFASWMAFSLPVTVLTLLASYAWMNIYVFGLMSTLRCKSDVTPEEVQRASDTIKEEYRKLGKMKFSEKIVLAHFLLLVGLWLTRNPGSIPGWSVLFKSNYISDGVVATAVAISLFVFPKERPNVLFFRRKGDDSPSRSTPAILSWRHVSRKFPWGVSFLLGGGFALSTASQVSGLSNVVAQKLLFIQHVPLWAASLVVTLLTSLVTEMTSNTVISMLMLPILRDIAIIMEVHPLYLMLPCAVASSLAFMLPVATPPNALVYAYGDVQVIDMMKTGCILNFLGTAVITIGINTWGYAYFDLATLPPWAMLLTATTSNATNFTMTTPIFDNITSTLLQ